MAIMTDRRTRRIPVPVSAIEHATYAQAAWRLGVGVAELFRQAANERVTPADRAAAAKRAKRLEDGR